MHLYRHNGNDEKGKVRGPPIDLTHTKLPDHGNWKTIDPLKKVYERKKPYNDSYPSDEVRDAYEKMYQKDYYSEKPLDSSDRNYQSIERNTFEEELPSKLGLYVNFLSLAIHGIQNPNPYQKNVSDIRDQLSQFIFYGKELNIRIHCHESVKNLCDAITKHFKNATLDQKRWLLFWIEDKLRKKGEDH